MPIGNDNFEVIKNLKRRLHFAIFLYNLVVQRSTVHTAAGYNKNNYKKIMCMLKSANGWFLKVHTSHATHLEQRTTIIK